VVHESSKLLLEMEGMLSRLVAAGKLIFPTFSRAVFNAALSFAGIENYCRTLVGGQWEKLI
jgi:hypothetical protein